jgi:N-acetylneuraminate synthase
MKTGDKMEHTMIVGDVCCNHQGDVSIALQLIDKAKECGFDAVKFQKRNPELYPETPKNSVFGKTYREHRRALELSRDNYNVISDYCQHIEMEWFASCWDIDSVDFIADYHPKYWKIASRCITNLELVEYIAKREGKIIMSTGMCENHDIYNALKIVAKGRKYPSVTLMHCCSEYPTPPDHVNLNVLRTWRSLKPHTLGYSSHDANPFTPAVAVALGAEVVEVHITLDRTMPGSDHAASLAPPGMRVLVERIRTVEKIMGSSEKQFYPAEREKRESMKQMEVARWA